MSDDKTLKQYINELLELVINHPGAENYIVVSSSDDEGNSFQPVYYAPAIGYYADREFQSVESAEENEEDIEPNAVVIN